MRTAHIFHHNDLDGIMSAAVFYEYVKYKERRYRLCRFYMIDYIKEIDLSEIPEDDMIVFLDYSFSNQHNLDQLKNAIESKKYKIVWIDHHATSLRVIDNDLGQMAHIDDHSGSFHYWIEDLYSATKLTYYWCLSRVKDTYNACSIILSDPAPKIIDYTNDHDLWKHEMYKTEEFVLGFSAKDLKPKAIFNTILKPLGDSFSANLFRIISKDGGLDRVQPKVVSFVESCIQMGTIIDQYNKVKYTRMLRSMSFEFTIKNEIKDISYNCIAMNTGGNSSVFLNEYDNHDIVCLFTYSNAGVYKYSLFSKHKDREMLDLSVIAEALSKYNKGSLGGGGSVSAAGFQHNNLLITPKCEIVYKKNLIGEPTITIKKAK